MKHFLKMLAAQLALTAVFVSIDQAVRTVVKTKVQGFLDKRAKNKSDR
jgi:hypothetical protein